MFQACQDSLQLEIHQKALLRAQMTSHNLEVPQQQLLESKIHCPEYETLYSVNCFLFCVLQDIYIQ